MAMYMSPRPLGGVHGSVTAGLRAAVRASASANIGLWGPVSEAPNWKRLTVSTPPARNTSPSPALMAWAAMRMVWSDDEQYRLTVTPGTSTPARRAATRATL